MTTNTPKFIDRERDLIPPVLIRAMLFLALSTLGLATFATLSNRPHEATPLAEGDALIVAERLFVLTGDPVTGAARLTEPDGTLINDYGINEGGFLVTMLRVVKRARLQRDVPLAAPLRLVQFENGQLTLIDPEGGWSTTLNGFGADNEAVFARLLED